MSGGDGGATARFAGMRIALAAAVLLVLVAGSAVTANAAFTDTVLISRASAPGNQPADGNSGSASLNGARDIAFSFNGRYVAFVSDANDLSDADNDSVRNVYLRDTVDNTTTLISRASGVDGAGADGDSGAPSVSPAGRFVTFESQADNLSTEDDNSFENVFVRDTATGETTLVSRGEGGVPADGNSSNPTITANGAFVAFQSDANNISSEDDDNVTNVFVRDMQLGTTALASRASGAAAPLSPPGDGNSFDPTISRDGFRVAFASDADSLSNKDDDNFTNIYVRDLKTKLTTVVTRMGNFLAGTPTDGNSGHPVLSGDGRWVAFTSDADNISAEDDDSLTNVYVRDIQATAPVLVSRADGATGATADASSFSPAISETGRFVAYVSPATNLSADDVATYDVYVRDVSKSVTDLVSRTSGRGAAGATGSSFEPALSPDGRYVGFLSEADNLSAEDDDAFWNVFARGLTFGAPPPPPPVDLGTNDHSGHDPNAHAGHTADEHAGHTAAEHANHVTATGAPTQTLVGPPVQDVDKLFVLSQVHADAKLVVTASVKLPGGGRASRLYRMRGVSRTVTAHKLLRIRLRLSKPGLRAVKRALKHHKRLRAVVVAKAQAAGGGPWGTATRKIRLRN